MEIRLLNEKMSRIRKMKIEVGNSLKRAPKGRLRSRMARGKYPQYYLISPEIRNKYPKGKYLKVSEKSLIRKLAQKEYDQRVLKVLEKQEKMIEMLLSDSGELSVQDVYNNLPVEKRSLITPYILPDDLFIQQWYERNKGGQNSREFVTEYVTERGEKVRSKSELLIANKLYYNKIPYQYEPRLVLEGGASICPDFVVLNVQTRKTYYLEHFGMMDDEKYTAGAFQKIQEYIKSGLFPGEQLLLTTETSMRGLDTQVVDLLINHYLV